MSADHETHETHHDAERPAFGYDGGDSYSRAVDAQTRAHRVSAHEDEHVVDYLLAGESPRMVEIALGYARKARAAATYADAVHRVEIDAMRTRVEQRALETARA